MDAIKPELGPSHIENHSITAVNKNAVGCACACTHKKCYGNIRGNMTDIDTLTCHHIPCRIAPVHASKVSVVILAKPVEMLVCCHIMRTVQRAVIVSAYLIFGAKHSAVPKIIHADIMLTSVNSTLDVNFLR